MTTSRRATARRDLDRRIAELVRSAAEAGSIVYPAEVVKALLAEFPDPALSPSEMAEEVMRQAAAAGAAVAIGGDRPG